MNKPYRYREISRPSKRRIRRKSSRGWRRALRRGVVRAQWTPELIDWVKETNTVVFNKGHAFFKHGKDCGRIRAMPAIEFETYIETIFQMDLINLLSLPLFAVYIPCDEDFYIWLKLRFDNIGPRIAR